MSMDYKNVIFCCSNLSQILQQTDQKQAFMNFEKFWNGIDNINEIFNEHIFLRQVIAGNLNHFDNQLVHQFLLNHAKNYFKESYSDFLINLRLTVFNDAISCSQTKNLIQYLPKNFDLEESLKISIKEGAWGSFTWFLNNYIPEKEHAKKIQWAYKEFWSYLNSGYSSFDFIQQLSRNPLCLNKPVKQSIYLLITDYNFHFLNKIITDEFCLPILKEINVDHYYSLLLKKITDTDNELYKSEGIVLLKNSYQLIPFDFSNIVFNKKFKKENPDIIQLIDNFILKDKLDSLPDKQSDKRFKI